ncbi:CPBP family intramembrane metalloprotease [Xylanimonas oleitrophica]|uniref:CPBP family intramembrane metalloprotease n=1 Tax=Xylanimonas oleitrophica TaxID=2607479 RepID=A0A2W5WNR5_9MICO|nr:CPBP family intramembrane metalloprotease [Xylanimonas oleitrophica]
MVSIPVVFLVAYLSTQVFGEGRAVIVIDALVRVVLCVAVLALYRHLLRAHWQRFRRRFWLNAGLVVLGAVLMQVVVSLVRAVVPAGGAGGAAGGADDAALIDPVTAQGWDLVVLLVATLGPLAIVLVEEAVFRHTLLVKLPLWGNRLVATAGVLLNGALFGAVHYYNFGSLVGTVPYMVVGVLFNLVYLWRRNLWHVLLMHFLNNFVLSFGALSFVLLMRALGAV